MFEAGSVIAGKYRLEEILGTGAMGVVWRARQLGLDRPVAVKLLHPTSASREEARVRFEREARVAGSLDHPNAVTVLDFGAQGDALYLVMELIHGESLRDRLERGPVPLELAVELIRQIAAALVAAHRIRLVHRDIKPENVILESTTEGVHARVVDFGLAFIDDPEPGSAAVGRMTQEGLLCGTPAYMSPEQVRGGAIGPASDIYSLGCVAYELISGEPPFGGPVAEILTRHAYAPVVSLRQLPLAEPPSAELDDLVLAMLAKSAPRRPSPNRLVAELARIQDRRPGAGAGRSMDPAAERSARMLPPPSETLPTEPGTETARLHVVGELPAELALALAAGGIVVVPGAPEGPWRPGVAVWAPGADDAELARLAGGGRPVLTDLDSHAAARLPALIRAGVAEALVRPVEAAELARHVKRALRLDAARGGDR